MVYRFSKRKVETVWGDVMDKEDIEKLKKKLLKRFDDEERTHCVICGKVIARYDIENSKFEYVKNSRGEKFAHTNCVKNR